MSDSYSDPQQNTRNIETTRDGGRGGFRGGRGPGNRDSGGFRIRLSDNEMRSARSIQEAFNLRSTVAVLGFALRTLGQMLEEGKLDDLVAQYKTQGPRNNFRREDNSGGSRRKNFDFDKQDSERGPKPNPFARPAKPNPSIKDEKKDSEDSSEEKTSTEKTQLQVETTQNIDAEPLETNQNLEDTKATQEKDSASPSEG